MYCSQCAAELSPDDVYCPQCAKPVASFATYDQQVAQVEPIGDEQQTIVRPARVKKSFTPYLVGAAFGAAAMGMFAAVLFFAIIGRNGAANDQAKINSANSTNEQPKTPSPTPEPTPTPTAELPVVLAKEPGFFTSKSCRYSNKGEPIMVRKDCDVRDCMNDPKTVVGLMPDGGIAILSDERKEVPAGRTYNWLPIETKDQGVLWIASNKVVCSK